MKKSNLFKETIIDIIQTVVILCAVIAVVYIFVGQLLEVTGNSMYPNFHDKEQIVAEKISVKSGVLPKRGDVVIFKHPFEKDKLIIKRVIGLPGEKITIRDGHVYINGELLIEPYIPSNVLTEGRRIMEEGAEYSIREGSYVVMGDNRVESTDSREWGYLDKELIVAKGVLVYYPIRNLRLITKIEY